ncbi:hypothetical protein SDC9_80922 [bioreactor metagenome]|uniref:Uncharacterized protein n=1 Tax=bioreactor metagenome TaxID=1076179 RepID=A0A644Z0D6_9ZZZZ
MKTFLSVIILGFCNCLTAICQTSVVPNQFVKGAYSDSQISEMTSERIDYLNFLSENAWEINDIPQEKQSIDNSPLLYKMDHETKMPLSTYFTCQDIVSFNLLEYNFAIKKDRVIYKIAGCQKWLIIKSHAEITDEYNEYRNL